MIDKYFFIMGGAERYCYELSDILKDRGHDVIPFSMTHARNFDSEYASYFVDEIDYDIQPAWKKAAKTPLYFSRMLYSVQAKKRLARLIEKVKPDIAHLHMIDHQLSPSILHALKNAGIPVLQTVHQYKLVCPNYRLYNMRTGQICEKCVGSHAFHPVVERCHKDSSMAGLMIALESSLHRWMKIYEKNIDLFHVPSHFMGRKLAEGGVDERKIDHLFYTIDLRDYPAHFDFEDYFIYYGRLAREKGILTLLKSMKKLPQCRLLLAGDGPQRPELEAFAEKNGLKNVTFLGVKGGDELKQWVSRARFVVVPSEWYDNSPLVIYESASMGKPVIGARIGGIPELIDHEKTGLLFHPGDHQELTVQIQSLWADEEKIRAFGKNARQKAESQFSTDYHYHEIMKRYQALTGK